jgi:hypothetical protein
MYPPIKCFTKKPDNLVVNSKHPILSWLELQPNCCKLVVYKKKKERK